jgi:hypothetical protein
MTHEDLINRGYKPEDCLIGTLYFKGNLFCRLDNGVASVRTVQDDMTDIGKASTIEELMKIEKDYLNALIGHTKEWATAILKLFDHYEKSNENL